VKDINSATQEDLMKVYGIGQVFIRKNFKDERGCGIVSMDQMHDVWD
jgi:DNA uptake protein ComE-like DNA-binding protein